MALINCSECDHQVSEKAEACPKCGAPIAAAHEAKAAGAQIKTMQETSKKFKLQTLLSSLLLIVGLVWLFAAMSDPTGEVSPIPTFMVLIGLVWYIINRFRIWWHHK